MCVHTDVVSEEKRSTNKKKEKKKKKTKERKNQHMCAYRLIYRLYWKTNEAIA